MKLEVSVGEAIDKYSILSIKLDNICDPDKKQEIINELLALDECKYYTQTYSVLYRILCYINNTIWMLTDKMRQTDISNMDFITISNDIFLYNDKRFKIKNLLNMITSSSIKEQKNSSSTYCNIVINSQESIYDKIPEINYLLCEYNFVVIDTEYIGLIKKLFNMPNILNNTNEKTCNTIILHDFVISNELKKIYDFDTLKYASSGKLGDFIQALSVINETFYNTGKKGIIYIRNNETFTFGLQHTYSDTYNVIVLQRYIADYKIYNNEPIDIDLDIWFKSPFMYKANWYEIFKNTYNIEWGKHKWLTVPFQDKWKDKVLINLMHYRFSCNIDYNKLFNMYGDSVLFISFGTEEYEYFKQRTNLNIPQYIPISFMDACVAINSCKLFIGGLSALLTIGHATHKDRFIGLSGGGSDDNHNMRFNEVWTNVYYDV